MSPPGFQEGRGRISWHLALKPCTESDLSPWASRPEVEREADDFATNLLLPEEFVTVRLKAKSPSLDFVGEVAREFSTSLTATALRYIELSGFPCAVVPPVERAGCRGGDARLV